MALAGYDTGTGGFHLAGVSTVMSSWLVIAGRRGENVLEKRQRVDATALAGNHDRVDNRGALAGIGVTDEQKVLFAKGRWPDGVFYSETVIMPRSRGQGRRITTRGQEKRRVQLGMIKLLPGTPAVGTVRGLFDVYLLRVRSAAEGTPPSS